MDINLLKTRETAMNELVVKSDYVDAIQNEWRNALSSILEVGNLLRLAADALGKREFHNMLSELPFSRRTAEKLMAISKDKRISNKKYANTLPPHWTTLYEITYLDDDTFKYGIEYGIITSDSDRADIVQLKKSQAPKPRTTTPIPQTDETERYRVAMVYSNKPLAKWQEDELQKKLEELIGKKKSLSYELQHHKPEKSDISARRTALADEKRKWLGKRVKSYNIGVKQDYIDLMIDAMYQRKSDRKFISDDDESYPPNDIRNPKNPFYGMNFKDIWNIAREKKIITPYSGIEVIDYEAFINNLVLQHCEGSATVREQIHKTLLRRTKSRNPRNAKLAKAAMDELVI